MTSDSTEPTNSTDSTEPTEPTDSTEPTGTGFNPVIGGVIYVVVGLVFLFLSYATDWDFLRPWIRSSNSTSTNNNTRTSRNVDRTTDICDWDSGPLSPFVCLLSICWHFVTWQPVQYFICFMIWPIVLIIRFIKWRWNMNSEGKTVSSISNNRGSTQSHQNSNPPSWRTAALAKQQQQQSPISGGRLKNLSKNYKSFLKKSKKIYKTRKLRKSRNKKKNNGLKKRLFYK